MTHSVAATPNAAAAAAATTSARAARATGTSFAQAHAAAVRGTEATGATTSASGSSSPASDAPKGERTQNVDGHHYVEIVNGPRNGMFINNTGGRRDGEAFLIVKRNGREFHIYGTGQDRAVYEVGRRRADGAGSGSTATNGTPGTTTGTSGPAVSTSSAASGSTTG